MGSNPLARLELATEYDPDKKAAGEALLRDLKLTAKPIPTKYAVAK